MAEDVAADEWNILVKTLKELSSTALSATDEVWKKDFQDILKRISQRESTFYDDHLPSVIKYLSHIVSLLAQVISVSGLIVEDEILLQKICEIIFKFCFKYINNAPNDLVFDQLQLFHTIERLYKFQPCFSQEDFTAIRSIELEVPKELVSTEAVSPTQECTKDILASLLSEIIEDSSLSVTGKSQLKENVCKHITLVVRQENGANKILCQLFKLGSLTEMCNQYENTLVAKNEKEIVMLEPKSIQLLAEELSLIRDMLSLPFMEPLTNELISHLDSLTEKSLKAALFLASGCYSVQQAEVTLPSGKTMKTEAFCRKFGWKATEHSLGVLDQVYSILSVSSRVDNFVCQNMHMKAVQTLLFGLQAILKKSEENREEKEQNWKWFEGLNIMLVTMTSRVMLLLTNLVEELKIEILPSSSSSQIDSFTSKELDLFTRMTYCQHLEYIFNSLPLPQLLLDLFFAVYKKGNQLTQMLLEKVSVERKISKSDSQSKKSDSGSGEENSLDDGLMLGNFFVQTLKQSSPSPDETPETSKEDIYAQSGEIFTLLASSLLEFSSKFFDVCCEKGFASYLERSITEKHLIELTTILESNETPDILVSVTKLLSDVVMKGVLIGEKLLLLQSAMRLDTAQLKPPLKLSRFSLAVFARIALKDVAKQEQKSFDYIGIVLNKFITALFDAAIDVDEKSYTNVEYMQVLVLLFQLLPKQMQENAFFSCLHAVQSLADSPITSPIHASHLLLFFEYILYNCYGKRSALLSLQVQKNVMLLDSSDEKYIPTFLPSKFDESKILKHENFTEKYKVFLDGPFFYEVNEHLKPDDKALQYLMENPDLNYDSFYESLLRLLCNAYDEVCETKSTDIFNVLGMRNMFLRIWSMLKILPVPSKSLMTMKTLSELPTQHQPYIIYLTWLPALYELQKNEIKSDIMNNCDDPQDKEMIQDVDVKVQIHYPYGANEESELDQIINSFPAISSNPSSILEYGQQLLPLITNLFNCENTLDFIPYFVADGLLMFFWLLVKKYVLAQKEKLEDGELLKDLVLGIMYLLKVQVEKSKELVIKHATLSQGEISEEDFEFYMDVVGVDLPEPNSPLATTTTATATESTQQQQKDDEPSYLKILPAGFKEALLKWKSIEVESNTSFIPALFQSIEIEEGKKNPAIGKVISDCLHNVIASHVRITSYETPYLSAAASLKLSIRTLADICEEFIPWMHENYKEDFEKLKPVALSTFSFLWIDHLACHISTHCEMLAMLCHDDGAAPDKLELIVFIRMLEIIDKWMLRAFDNSSVVGEKYLIHWLEFLASMIDHSKTLPIFLQYYTRREEGLSQIFYSIIKYSYTDEYISAYYSLFSRIFNLYSQQGVLLHQTVCGVPQEKGAIERRRRQNSADENNAEGIKSALLKICQEDEAKTTKWVQAMISSRDVTLNGCNLLCNVVNKAIQHGLTLEKFLPGLMTFCSETIGKITEETITLPPNFKFSSLFDIVVITATACGEEGHLQLFKSVTRCLIDYIDVWKKSLSNEEEVKTANHIKDCCNTLVVYVTKIISSSLSNQDDTNTSLDSVEEGNSRDAFEMLDFSQVMSMTNEEEEPETAESDDELEGKVCTFTITQRDFMNQHWYHCHTCKMSDGVGCCTICAKICHKGHDVTYSKHGSFFCDCGAKEDGSCKAMTPKRSSGTSLSSKSSKSISPFAAWGEQTVKRSTTKKKQRFPPQDSHLHLRSEDMFILRQIMKDSQKTILEIVQQTGIFDVLMELLSATNDSFQAGVNKQKERLQKIRDETEERMKQLYSNEKECKTVENLMNAVSGSQEGAFENIKLNYSGDQGQTLRQLMLAHVVHHQAMCLIASPKGRRQHLAIAHEKGKVTILQLSGLLRQPESNQKKMTLNRLSSTIMPFTVLCMASNPLNDDYLAVTGLKDCHILILGQSGNTPSHLALSSKLETGNFIIKALWVPASQTKLALITADFVKVYDLSISEKEPIHHFLLPSGKVRDATFIPTDSGVNVTIMSSQGYIYTETLNDASGNEAFYMMNVMNNSAVEDTGQGMLNGGGVSVYYSLQMKLLFFSYSKGKSFIGALDKTVSGFSHVFPVNSSTPLIQWSDVPGQFGLVHCTQQNTGNVIVMAVKPEKINMQEIKSPSKSSKVQSAVCCYHSSLESKKHTVSFRTTLIVLLDDGSLRIFNANQEEIEFTPKQTVLESSPFAGATELHSDNNKEKVKITRKQLSNKGRTGGSSSSNKTTKFPVDFFEHCQVTNDIEFGGADILHVYNKAQVKNRLNTAGMYIANTKPAGFKIEVSYTNATHMIVAVRIQVGVNSMERSPQYVEILGRIVQMRMAKNRWFDIPLTREEAIKVVEQNKLTVVFGPSSDPYGLSIVDSVKVYTKSKEAFGYNVENQATDTAKDTTTAMTATTTVSEISAPVENKRPVSYSETLFSTLLSSIQKCITLQQLELKETSPVFTVLLQIASAHLAMEPQFYSQYSLLNQQFLVLLRSLYSTDAKFFDTKDELQVSYLLGKFTEAQTEAKEKEKEIDLPMLVLVLGIAESVGSARPENLVKFIGPEKVTSFANDIMSTFGQLHQRLTSDTNNLNNNKQELTQLSHTVELMIEVLFALMLGDSSQIDYMSQLIMNLLLHKDQSVSFAAKQGLIKSLQSRQTGLNDEDSSSKSAEDKDEDTKTKGLDQEDAPSTPTPSSQPPPSTATDSGLPQDLPQDQQQLQQLITDEVEGNAENEDDDDDDDDDDDGVVINDNDIMSSQSLQMLLDDDSTMMEIALALSLQGQANQENAVDVGEQVDQIQLVDDDGDIVMVQEIEDDEEDEDEEELVTDEVVNSNGNDDHVDGDASDNANGLDQEEEEEEDDEAQEEEEESFSESPSFIEKNSNLISTEKPDSVFRVLWKRLLRIFTGKIPDLLELDGLQAIPFLQVLLILCSNLSEEQEDEEILEQVVTACVQPLRINDKDVSNISERSSEHEVQLVLMRFLSVLMSRTSSSKSKGKEKSEDVKTSDSFVAKMLSKIGLVDHCLNLLKNLHGYWQNAKDTGEEGLNPTTSEGGNLLTIKPLLPTPDMMPFFMEQYVKSHAMDLFEAFPQLVTEMILRVPYQIHKLLDNSSEEKYFIKNWTFVLCEYMLIPHTPFVRRQVRKLLLALCGTKEKYRYVKDLHNLRSHLSQLRELLQHSGIVLDETPTRNISLSYEETVSLEKGTSQDVDVKNQTENISACIEIAAARGENWQSFCKKEKAILPFLIQASYQVNDLVSSKFIELVSLAITTTSSSSSKKHDKSEKKEKSKTTSIEMINHVFTRCFGPILTSFIKNFLLESNSTQLRWKVHNFIHTMFQNISKDQQVSMVELLWTLWEKVPSYGHRATQFVDLLGYFTINCEELNDNKVTEYVSSLMGMLKEGNVSLKNHPNAGLYRKLQSYIDLDGFYLESEPCIICNNPEVASNSYKLSALKSDIRYTTKSQIIKLNANHTISKINLKVSDVKRAKMVKTINIYYNNKPVPSVVELKSKTGIWQKAKKLTLTQGQTEIKVDLTFPITAYNLMLEFSEFYDNAQFSSESLQCPRCSASVPAHPGVCSNCGENVYQCHKCRAINYDEKDPFFCTSCGFCKYAKFEFTLTSHPCTSVEAIHNEDDRDKALKSVNASLEKADQFYQQLITHRGTLETLLKNAKNQNIASSQSQETSGMAWNVSSLATTSNQPAATSSAAVAMASINHSIQGVAQRYCVDAKQAFEEMSKVMQTVTATREELAQYDVKQKENLSQAMFSTPSVSPSSLNDPPSFVRTPSFPGVAEVSKVHRAQSTESSSSGVSKCYGCALSTIHHSLTLLRAMVTLPITHKLMLDRGLLHELVEHNLQQRMSEIVSLSQTLLIQLTSNNKAANGQLNDIICNRISLCLSTQAANMVSEISLSSELSVLKQSILSDDMLWEERFKCVFKLFLDSLHHANPEILEAVTLPCLEIIEGCMKNKQPDNKKVIRIGKSKKSKQKPSTKPSQSVDTMKWLEGSVLDSLDAWKQSETTSSETETTSYNLMKKYGRIWLQKTVKKSEKTSSDGLNAPFLSGWLRLLLFLPSSSSMRLIICKIIETLAEVFIGAISQDVNVKVQDPNKKQTILHLLMSYLNELHSSGENAVEYLNLVKTMLNKSAWKVYLCHFGILNKLCKLLTEEVAHLTSLENSTLNFDLAQGYALFALAELLKSFLEDEEVKVLYRGRYVAEVLQCYLALRKLVVQRTKLVDESQEILLTLLHQLTSGTDESVFMKTCVDALKQCPVNDIRTPVFIFEQLCNVIHKEEDKTSEFFMLLEKDPQQEDYLQGRMQGNPYSSKDEGLGPLMRDLKNKICTECELVALLEDDTGMELLVDNKIISLDLPVDKVYRKVWVTTGSKDPMKVVYRMRGLLGDATEDMIENLDTEKEKDVDEEREYQKAGIMVEINGLNVLLKRLSYIRDLSQAQPLITVLLKLLEYCVKVKRARQYLHQPSVNAMKIMLATLNLALRLERDHGSTSGGASIAERVLKVMEIILHEATAEAHVKQVTLTDGEDSQLELFLNHITSPYVRSNQNVLQAMMRLTPFLTFGSEEAMNTLIEHFLTFFDFDSFDKDKSADVILHLDCFVMIAEGINESVSGSNLKDLIISKGVISKALNHLHQHAPPKSFRDSGILDSAKWKDFLSRSSLPYILRMLTGLINGHAGTAAVLATDENVGLLHHLEQVSSEEMVGSLAENLMEALREFPDGKKKVVEVRRKTRNEKKALAMAMRQKQLESLGMEVTSSGHIKSKVAASNTEMKELLEESDQRMVCCICREGYKFYPNKVLGIYTFTTRTVLDEFENKPKRSQGYTTVTHFNVVHFDCHLEAVRHARTRDEWESAALQNGNVKCNGLLPIWGPKVSESSFAQCLARHNNYLQECTGFREPTFHSTVHDINLMLLRFAHQKSFSNETGGGGKLSNILILPYMIHNGLYVLNTTRQRMNEETIMTSFLDAPVDTWITSCYEVNSPLFASTLSLFVTSYSDWKKNRLLFFKRLVLLAHVRSISPQPMNNVTLIERLKRCENYLNVIVTFHRKKVFHKTLTSKIRLVNCEMKAYSIYKPTLLFFFLIEQLHKLIKDHLSSDDDWQQALSTYLRNNDETLLKEAEKILKTFDEELLPCESFAEYLDVCGLLEEIPDNETFIKDLLKPYGVEETEVFC